MPKRRCTVNAANMRSTVINWTGNRVQELVNRTATSGATPVNSTRLPGLHVELLKHLNVEGKIGSQKDSPGNLTLFRLRIHRADGIQEHICINEGPHDDKVLRALPDGKLGSVRSERKLPLEDVPIF
jgi:hypothetical protein